MRYYVLIKDFAKVEKNNCIKQKQVNLDKRNEFLNNIITFVVIKKAANMSKKIVLLLFIMWSGTLVAQKPSYTETLMSRPQQQERSPVELFVEPETKDDSKTEQTTERKQRQAETVVDAKPSKIVVTTLLNEVAEGTVSIESAEGHAGSASTNLSITNATLVEYVIDKEDFDNITIENSTIYSLVIINSTANYFTITGPVNISKLTIKSSFINDVFFEDALINDLQIENTEILTFVTEDTFIKNQSIITTSTSINAAGE